MAAGSTVPTGHVGSNDAPDGSAGAGVTQIIAGTGVTLTPPTGVGAVQIDTLDAVARAAAAAAAAAAAGAQADADAAQSTADGAVVDAAAAAAAAAAAVQDISGDGGVTIGGTTQHPTIAVTNPVAYSYYPQVGGLPGIDATIGVAPSGTAADATHGTFFQLNSIAGAVVFTLSTVGTLPGEQLFVRINSGLSFTATFRDGGVSGLDLFVSPLSDFPDGARLLVAFKMNAAGDSWLFDSVARIV